MSSFELDALKLVGGTVITQALIILASPLITRIYGPEAFGISAIFASLISILSIIACLRYELAIMLPKNDEDAANLLALSLLLVVLVSVLIISPIELLGQPILQLLKAPGLAPYLWLMPVSIFINGVFLAVNYWTSRAKHFGSLSIAKVISSVVTTSMQVGAGLEGYATGGSLIIAGLTGSALSTIILCQQIWRDDGYLLKRCISLPNMLMGLKRYKRFPIFDTWSALMNSISWQLPIFLLSIFFSPIVVGYYSLGMMALQFPANLIGSAVSQVFFQRAAEAKFNGTLPKVVESTLLRLAIIGALPIMLLFITGKEVFIVIFGVHWAEAGIYAQILAIWIFFVFIISPLSTIFSIFEKQKTLLIFNIILLGTRAMALIIGSFSGNARVALILFSVVGTLDYAIMGLWIIHKANVSILKILRDFRIYAVYCILLLGLIALAKSLRFLSPQGILLLDAFAAFSYYLLFLKARNVISYQKIR